MEIPFSTFIKSVEEKKIYFFKNNPPLGVNEHLHICLKKPDGKMLYMVCCTTKIDTIKKFIEAKKLPLTTMVYLKPDQNNNFDDETYINCNSVHSCTQQEFAKYFSTANITHIGEITTGQYVQILQGIVDSKIVTQNTKEILKNLLSTYDQN